MGSIRDRVDSSLGDWLRGRLEGKLRISLRDSLDGRFGV